VGDAYLSSLAMRSIGIVSPPPVVTVTPGDSSYFTHPKPELDPRLFEGRTMRPEVRRRLLNDLYTFWSAKFSKALMWSRLYLAGSAASYQWHSTDGPGDLDMLVGVDFGQFRESNPLYDGEDDVSLARVFNRMFAERLNGPWWGYDRTWYVNPGAFDIRVIHPYAAYDLTRDRWASPPMELPPDWNPRVFFPEPWWATVGREQRQIVRLIDEYNRLSAAQERGDRSGALRFAEVVQELLQSYEDIHTGRKQAFSPSGLGYADFANFRWQAHKMAGTEQALRQIKDYYDVG